MAVQDDAPFYDLKFDCFNIVSNMSAGFSQSQFKQTFENLNQTAYLSLFWKFHKQKKSWWEANEESDFLIKPWIRAWSLFLKL